MLDINEAIKQAKRETMGIDSNGQMSLEDAISVAKEENNWFHPVDWANAAAIGAADMFTTNLIGGAGLVSRELGWLWEQITPWNGIDNALAEELSNLGFTPDEIERLAYNNSWLTDTGNTLLEARNVFNRALDYAQKSTIGDNPDLITELLEVQV